jgi:hypothetical protein
VNPVKIQFLRYAGRPNLSNRMVHGVFQVSDTNDFAVTVDIICLTYIPS